MDFVFIPLGIVNGLCQSHLDKCTHASLYPAYKCLFQQNLLCFHFPFYVSSNATNKRFNYVDIFLWKAWGVISWFISFVTGHFGWILDSLPTPPLVWRGLDLFWGMLPTMVELVLPKQSCSSHFLLKNFVLLPNTYWIKSTQTLAPTLLTLSLTTPSFPKSQGSVKLDSCVQTHFLTTSINKFTSKPGFEYPQNRMWELRF